MNKIFYIYLLQNKINNKIYVGYSSNPEKRWRSEKSAAFLSNDKEYNNPLYKAIRRDGWDNFEKIKIESWNSKEEALEAEKFWIAFFHSNRNKYGSEFGYNLTDGGDDPPIKKKGQKSKTPPWNKGKKGVMPVPWNKGKKGLMPSPWNKGTKGLVKPPPNKKITLEQAEIIKNSQLSILDLSRLFKVDRKTIRYYRK